jgi:hypothetical protein
MTSTTFLRTIGLAAAATLGILIGVAPATAVSAAPEMSVTISDGVKTVKPGMGVTYTTKVTNLGADPVDAKIVVAVPSYVEVGDAGTGTVDKQTVTWAATVAPHETSDLKLTVTVGDIPKGDVRVTAVASVYVDGVEPSPLIRSADADRIQGVADTPAPKASTAPATASHGSATGTVVTVIVIVVVAILVVAAAVVTVMFRRRRVRRRAG